jgi:hypothetical protein
MKELAIGSVIFLIGYILVKEGNILRSNKSSILGKRG